MLVRGYKFRIAMDAILAIAPCDPCVIERSNGDLLYELTPREWPIFTQSIIQILREYDSPVAMTLYVG